MYMILSSIDLLKLYRDGVLGNILKEGCSQEKKSTFLIIQGVNNLNTILNVRMLVDMHYTRVFGYSIMLEVMFPNI